MQVIIEWFSLKGKKMLKKSMRRKAILIILALSSAKLFAAEAVGQDSQWERLLYRSLQFYYVGDYNSTYANIKKAVDELEPGPQVHRCIALMRLSFFKERGIDPAGALRALPENKDVELYIKNLEKNKTPKIGDMVVLAAIKEEGRGSFKEKIRILDSIIESASPWADWAFWEKTQTLSRKMAWFYTRKNLRSCSLEDLGVAEFKKDETVLKLGCLVDTYPDRVFIARAARLFLEEHPDTYMARQMEKDVWYNQINLVYRSFSEIKERYDENKSLIWTEAQLQALKSWPEDMRKIVEELPNTQVELLTAEEYVDEFLQGCAETDRIVVYLRAVSHVKGDGVFDDTLISWLNSIPEQEEMLEGIDADLE
jgi:hypothetical protein